VIKAAQRLGFTLAEIADLLATGQRAHPTPDLQDRARAKLDEIDHKLSDLTLIRETLNQVIAADCDSLTACSCTDCPLPFAELAEGDAT
jgi:DNA-binding transcriptional MerR regulator